MRQSSSLRTELSGNYRKVLFDFFAGFTYNDYNLAMYPAGNIINYEKDVKL